MVFVLLKATIILVCLNFPDLGAVIRRSGPFFAVDLGRVGFVLYMCYQFSFEI